LRRDADSQAFTTFANFGVFLGLSTTGLFFSSGGGKGANQATSVARLGVPTALVGRIGNDAISQASRHAHDEAP